MLAGAIKFRANMNIWLDTGSSGPANLYPLMWPFVFGADTGFAVARITAIALLGGTWLLIFSALASTTRPVRICLGACLILFLGGDSKGRIHPLLKRTSFCISSDVRYEGDPYWG